jgi:hypothetical protein
MESANGDRILSDAYLMWMSAKERISTSPPHTKAGSSPDHAAPDRSRPARIRVRSVPGVIAIATVLIIVACSAPPQTAAPSDASASAPPATATANPRPTTTAPPSGPVSAGAVPDAGLLLFFDYGGDLDQTVTPALYRYDGASGALSQISGWFSGSMAHETAGGIYVQGPQGRWDLLRWNGSRAGDDEFTACQQEPGYFASWCSVSANGVGVGFGSHTGPGPGPFTGPWCPPAFIRLPGTARSTNFPPELCVQGARVSADGKQIMIVDVARQASPGAPVGGRCQPGYVAFDERACYEQRVWIMPVGGTPRQLRLSPALPGFVPGELSPDGRSAVGTHDGALVHVDVMTGKTTSLGPAHPSTLPRWSANGGLAFARGAEDESWIDRNIVVVAADGSTRDVRVSSSRSDGKNAWAIGLAPTWDTAGRRLAWIASPAGTPGAGAAQDYLDGRAAGDRRVLVSDLTSDPLEIRCGEGVAEGVRWSHDGTALLLLCRRPGARVDAFELWLHRLGAPGGASVPIVRGITWGGVDAHGFAPDLLGHTAWFRAVATGSP